VNFRRDVEFENPRGFLAVDPFPILLLGVPQRAFKQAVQELAILRGGKPSNPLERRRLTLL